MGNIHVSLEPTVAGEPLFFCAHLDTVPPVDAIEPVVEDGIVRNRLPGDPRQRQQGRGRRDARRRPPRPRRGPAARRDRARSSPRRRRSGSSAPTRSTTRASAPAPATSTTRPSPIGCVILGAPSAMMLEVEFHGRAAHAGMFPEEGRSAIVAAARAIAEMRARPDRRGDDREHRHDRGRKRRERRPELVPPRRGGALARRAQARRAGAGDAGRDHLRRRRRRVRGRDEAREALHRLPVREGRPAPSGSPPRRSAGAASSRATRSRAAPPTRTSSTSAACSA